MPLNKETKPIKTFGLVISFNGVSTPVGYLMPNSVFIYDL